MDARTGKILHSRNSNTRLHPASLTKMMTLYVAFQAVENGEISLDTPVLVSRNAASEPPSKLYLKAGQRIKLRYLIRGAAVRSANDAATAIAEAISGSEAAFTARMTRTARAMGMSNTTFRNAHGLTQSGHLSTARDMTILGRHLFYDYPEYYNLFSRRSTHAGVATVNNTNNRLLSAYRGADGIKTGYTRAAGSNLVASAERGGVRIIVTHFGGRSSAARNARVIELLDMGFARAPKRAATRKPSPPSYFASISGGVAVARSPIPQRKPAIPLDLASLYVAAEPKAVSDDEATDALAAQITEGAATEGTAQIADAIGGVSEDALAAAIAAATTVETDSAPRASAPEATMLQSIEDTLAALPPVVADVPPVGADAEPSETQAVAAALPVQPAIVIPKRKPARVVFSTASSVVTSETRREQVVISTKSPNAGGWGVRVGKFPTRWHAERVMLQTALKETDLLQSTEQRVVQQSQGFEVQFVGLSEQAAQLTCRRLGTSDHGCDPFSL
ncbi:MAG: D-alanyl-D-alanine carboxypeptidase family protein [Pseudomonadota bacterium]